MGAYIIRGDARALPLPDASVDLIVTSPPYFGLRSYQDGGEHYAGQIGAEATPAEYVAALLECTREWMRVLKPEGSIFVNLSDKYSYGDAQAGHIPAKSLMLLPERYALGCIDDLGLILRAEVIWSKPTPLPESVTDRVCRSHERWLHLTRQQRYFADLDAIREPHRAPDRNHGRNAMKGRNVNIVRTGTGAYEGPNPLGKLPGSVWTIATQPLKVPAELEVDHFAAFPLEWPRRIITGWSPPGGVVADPFVGTGTTALVADVLGRHGISIDRSADYCRLAAWRTADAGERARVLGKPKPPAVMDGQAALFEEIS